jgi:cytochrome c oxidase assembly protein subunit 15
MRGGLARTVAVCPSVFILRTQAHKSLTQISRNPRAMSAATTVSNRPVAFWILAIAAMVFVTVVIGGATRLTESGLSMVEWRPLIGWIPPLSDAAWQELFDKYKATPQFQKLFPTMDLAGFKAIFWLEYIHRVWGRLIGVAFALPFLWFLIRGRLTRPMIPHLVGLFLLGAAQGALGWYMVASGLVDRPSVSQYRLAAHLGLALLIFVYLLWFGLGLLQPRGGDRVLLRKSIPIFLLLALTVLVGAFVAGLDAGKIYNTFPTMGGYVFPPWLWRPELGLLNLFENQVTVQWLHRVLAIVTVFAVCLFAMGISGGPRPAAVKRAAGYMAGAVLVQFGLGIVTLLTSVPVHWGTVHQGWAVVLIGSAVWFAHVSLRREGQA